jgi:hypothetical protein
MVEEVKSIEGNATWELIDPPGSRPIGLKWVFKVKRDEQGAIVKRNALSLVASSSARGSTSRRSSH